MKKRLILLAVVAAVVVVVLWLKSWTANEPTTPNTPVPALSAGTEQADTLTVLLFADPREAEESCGCAEVIRLARGIRGAPGVVFREIDTRNPGEDARRYGVRVSPSVVFTNAAGEEHVRFEGESPAVIEALSEALDDLRRSATPAVSGGAQ